MFPLTPELRDVLAAQLERSRIFERAAGQIVRWLFHRGGKPIKSFRRSWLTACKLAGLPGRLQHDFRRTAVRNLERAGISRSAAMAMVGHHTQSFYQRYAIADETALKEAADKLTNFRARQMSQKGGPEVMRLKRIKYSELNPREKEVYNFHKLSAVLADFGYSTQWLSSDWKGPDFIARHLDGPVIQVQLKSRLAFFKKYRGKGLYAAFAEDGTWYLYPHDELLDRVLQATNIAETVSMGERGGYSWPRISQQLKPLLDPYRIQMSTDWAPH
jgi:transposase